MNDELSKEQISGSEVSNSQDINKWCLLIHLSSFLAYIVPLAGLVVPLVLWQIKKEVPRIDMHGREVMNYTMTFVLYWIFAFLLMLIVVGIPLMMLLGAYSIAVPIIAAVKAHEGKFYKYPLIIRFL